MIGSTERSIGRPIGRRTVRRVASSTEIRPSRRPSVATSDPGVRTRPVRRPRGRSPDRSPWLPGWPEPYRPTRGCGFSNRERGCDARRTKLEETGRRRRARPRCGEEKPRRSIDRFHRRANANRERTRPVSTHFGSSAIIIVVVEFPSSNRVVRSVRFRPRARLACASAPHPSSRVHPRRRARSSSSPRAFLVARVRRRRRRRREFHPRRRTHLGESVHRRVGSSFASRCPVRSTGRGETGETGRDEPAPGFFRRRGRWLCLPFLMGRERSMATFKSHKDEDEDAPDRSGIALVSGEKIRRITCFGGAGGRRGRWDGSRSVEINPRTGEI